MSLEVNVGPPRLSINQGYAVLVTDQDGSIPWPTDKGFYHSDTRLISAWAIYADGETFTLLNSGNIAYYASRIFLTNKTINTADGVIAAGTLALTISRCLSGGGVHEDLDLVNNSQEAVVFNLEIVVRSDFADLFEVKSGKIIRRGRIETIWNPEARTLQTSYRNKDFKRDLIVTVAKARIKPVYSNGRISFRVSLPPHGKWHACVLYEVCEGDTRHEAPAPCISGAVRSLSAKHLDSWRDVALKATSSDPSFTRFYTQSLDDMAALRLPIEGTDHLEFVPAGGVPWFVALFGRDSLIVSLQNAMVYPNFAHGALDVLGRLQATQRDDWRDAEPGKIPHELRRGELAHFKLVPHTPYYGTADATILYLIVLHNAWRCIGDDALLKSFMPVAEKCLTWIDRYGDRDGDGFQEYQTRSSAGYENMGWKDSGEALVYEDGSLVKGPKALVELQGYVYDAWLRMAQVYEALGQAGKARGLRTKAQRLFDRFNEAFWDEETGYYAFCLDGEKKKVMSVASNPGHLLWSGIVPEDRAARVVARLMARDMQTGWGVRTLSADHPAFNPNSYQVGSVWPHDNAIIAQGFRRYGFVKEAHQIAADVTNAAGYFSLCQMPELYSGIRREPLNFPVQYLGANVPQGWAAGSCFHLLQMIVGFQPDAPGDRLYLDPALPDWMPDLTICDLRVGTNLFDIRFWRDGAASRWDVIKGDATKVQQHAFEGAHRRWL
ncbi:MAG TPA: glycogen debranching N-terminal domain-containing protein [Caulobacteraceae bacterium]|jgi:glycogen debranching enzyme|nr:glycogen debranching N-terminal domain-containing protein [Caulobacteraceae bacterium]